MGLLGIVLKVVGALLLVVIGLGAYLWFTDYAAEATVTDRSGACPPGEIEVTPRLYSGYKHRTTLDCGVWPFVCEGFEVVFHVQTKQYRVMDDSGRVVYDSRTGDADTVGLARCGASNLV